MPKYFKENNSYQNETSKYGLWKQEIQPYTSNTRQ